MTAAQWKAGAARFSDAGPESFNIQTGYWSLEVINIPTGVNEPCRVCFCVFFMCAAEQSKESHEH